MPSLYFAPGTSSMASHIALHEIGVPVESYPAFVCPRRTTPVVLSGAQYGGKVPTLMIDGRPLTEVAALLYYLARTYPAAGLMPANDAEAEAQVISWMSFIASTSHPARFRGAEQTRSVYAIADERLGDSGRAVGRYSMRISICFD